MPLFYNQAQLFYNGNQTASNVTQGERVGVISAEKNSLNTGFSAGENISYIINIVNSGLTALTGLTVTDNLGAMTVSTGAIVPLSYVEGSLLYYVDGELRNTATATATATELVISNVDVPAGGSAVIAYQATVNEYAPVYDNATITNTAEIAGGGITTAIEVKDTIASTDAPELSITKTISPERVTENGRITYSFIITNTGNTAATVDDAVSVSDVFDPVLTQIDGRLDGDVLTRNTEYTYNEQTGEFAVVDGVITVPAATYERNADNVVITTPGTAILTVSGNIS